MILENMPALRQLPPKAKRQLAEELWDNADVEEGEVRVEAGVLMLLDQRLAGHAADPSCVSTWDEVKSRVFSRSEE
ncbi:MAG: addiction module protein [Verrucomicrobiaceae bacterium]|jgi:putative addiction module component (TIGR02574 family)|nr:addiction module protein [Verrucomicrobiaceae bacterium]